MKRSPRTVFDDRGHKWFESPLFKEVKLEGRTGDRQISSTFDYYGEQIKLVRDKFYDFYNRVASHGQQLSNLEDICKNLTISIQDIPDSNTVQEIFERLNSRVAMNSKGKKAWTDEETSFLIWIVVQYCNTSKIDYHSMSDNDWDYIASMVPGKNSEACKSRWSSLLKLNVSRLPWSQQEDDLLVQIINEKGQKKWKEIAIDLNEQMNNTQAPRQGKQCRERWINHLDPSINRGIWSAEEDIMLMNLQLKVGKKWAEISKRLKTRTENAVKNRWHSLMKKKKQEYSSDSDSVSQVSSSLHDDELEKRLAQLIIEDKEKEYSRMGTPYEQRDLDVIQEYSPEGEGEIKSEYKSPAEMDLQFTKKSSSTKKNNVLVRDHLKSLVTEEMGGKQKQSDNTDMEDPEQSAQVNFSGIIQTFNNSNPNNQNTFRPSGGNNIMESPGFFKSQGFEGQNQTSNLFSGETQNNSGIFQSPSLNRLINTQNQNSFIGNPYPNNTINNNNTNTSSNNNNNPNNISESTNLSSENKSNEPMAQEQGDDFVYKFVQKPISLLATQMEFSSGQNQNVAEGLNHAIIDFNNNCFYVVSSASRESISLQMQQAGNSLSNLNDHRRFNNEKSVFSKRVSMDLTSPALGNINSTPDLFGGNSFANIMKNSPGNGLWNESPQIKNNFMNFGTNSGGNAGGSSFFSSFNPNNNNFNNVNNINNQSNTITNSINNNNNNSNPQLPGSGNLFNSENPAGFNEWTTPDTTFRPLDQGKIKPMNLMWGVDNNYKGPNSPDNRFSASNSAFLRKQIEKKGQITPC